MQSIFKCPGYSELKSISQFPITERFHSLLNPAVKRGKWSAGKPNMAKYERDSDK